MNCEKQSKQPGDSELALHHFGILLVPLMLPLFRFAYAFSNVYSFYDKGRLLDNTKLLYQLHLIQNIDKTSNFFSLLAWFLTCRLNGPR